MFRDAEVRQLEPRRVDWGWRGVRRGRSEQPRGTSRAHVAVPAQLPLVLAVASGDYRRRDLLRQQNVGSLHISVQNLLRVQVLQSPRDLSVASNNNVWGEQRVSPFFAFFNSPLQIPAWHIF